jgi:ABC-type nitrate/sulfonate/bicarbonate transport system permease component
MKDPAGLRLLRFYLVHERVLLGLAMALLVLLMWEGFGRGWWADLLSPLLGSSANVLRLRPIFVSSPTAVAGAALQLYFVTGEIWPHLATSGLELLAGLSAAAVIGIPAGLVTGRYRLLSAATEPFVSAFNATPQVAFLPLLVLWIGTGFPTRVLIIVLLAVLPIMINAHAAVRTVDPRLMTVARSFGASEAWTFFSIILPSSVPFLLAGLRLAIGRGMIGIVVGELYGSAVGVGIMMNRAGSLFQTDKVFVGVLTIVVAGLALTEIVRRIEQKVEIWRAPGLEPSS